MTRVVALFGLLVAVALPGSALAQGQIPGTLPPAPAVVPPPPLAIPAPVPPSVSLAVPPAPGMSPRSGTYVEPIYQRSQVIRRVTPRKKKVRPLKRRPVSEIPANKAPLAFAPRQHIALTVSPAIVSD
jgi:hypothetical protein